MWVPKNHCLARIDAVSTYEEQAAGLPEFFGEHNTADVSEVAAWDARLRTLEGTRYRRSQAQEDREARLWEQLALRRLLLAWPSGLERLALSDLSEEEGDWCLGLSQCVRSSPEVAIDWVALEAEVGFCQPPQWWARRNLFEFLRQPGGVSQAQVAAYWEQAVGLEQLAAWREQTLAQALPSAPSCPRPRL